VVPEQLPVATWRSCRPTRSLHRGGATGSQKSRRLARVEPVVAGAAVHLALVVPPARGADLGRAQHARKNSLVKFVGSRRVAGFSGSEYSQEGGLERASAQRRLLPRAAAAQLPHSAAAATRVSIAASVVRREGVPPFRRAPPEASGDESVGSAPVRGAESTEPLHETRGSSADTTASEAIAASVRRNIAALPHGHDEQGKARPQRFIHGVDVGGCERDGPGCRAHRIVTPPPCREADRRCLPRRGDRGDPVSTGAATGWL